MQIGQDLPLNPIQFPKLNKKWFCKLHPEKPAIFLSRQMDKAQGIDVFCEICKIQENDNVIQLEIEAILSGTISNESLRELLPFSASQIEKEQSKIQIQLSNLRQELQLIQRNISNTIKVADENLKQKEQATNDYLQQLKQKVRTRELKSIISSEKFSSEEKSQKINHLFSEVKLESETIRDSIDKIFVETRQIYEKINNSRNDITLSFLGNLSSNENNQFQQNNIKQIPNLGLEVLNSKNTKFGSSLLDQEKSLKENQDESFNFSKSLDEKDRKFISKIVTQIIKSKSNQNQNKDTCLKSFHLIQLVDNKSNFCSDLFKQQISDLFTLLEPLLNTFEIDRIITRSFTSNLFEQIENHSLDQIFVLINLISQVMKTERENLKNHKQSVIYDEACSKIMKNASQEIKNLIKEQNDRKEILRSNCKMEFEQEGKLIPFSFVSTKYKQSQQLQLKEQEESVEILQLKSLNGSVVSSEYLDNKKVYIFRCHFNKKLFGINSILIGICTDDVKDKWMLSGQDHGLYCSFYGDGPKELVKGKFINQLDYLNSPNSLEIRISIQTQEFYIADYPAYQNINKVEQIYIDENQTNYRFGIGFLEPGDNWKVNMELFKISDNPLMASKFVKNI